MMSEKEFLKSQKECASMIGMTLKEYNEYLEKVKVNDDIKKDTIDSNFLKAINIEESQLKLKNK